MLFSGIYEVVNMYACIHFLQSATRSVTRCGRAMQIQVLAEEWKSKELLHGAIWSKHLTKVMWDHGGTELDKLVGNMLYIRVPFSFDWLIYDHLQLQVIQLLWFESTISGDTWCNCTWCYNSWLHFKLNVINKRAQGKGTKKPNKLNLKILKMDYLQQ